MRLHISVDDEVVRQLDALVAPRERSAFIVAALKAALEEQARWASLEKAFGSISSTGHDWDADPAQWVHDQRYADPKRVG